MSRPSESGQSATPRFGRIDAGLDQVESAVAQAREFLFSQQHPDGYWCGELEADTTLESDYIMVHTLLGTGDERKTKRAVAEILRKQNEDGGWSIYAGGPSNISASVKAYFAFKLMGWQPDHPVMVHAREWILAHGGVVECNTFTKIYLCFFGQYEYGAVPAIPPELVLFPNWCYFNIY
jgi:squalene-hopene/tetraprenyl-beta-curcumene cyclase